jgi:flagellar biosynthetic protein FlhB
MAEQDTSQERTEQATPRRLQQAREKGQVPRSRELSTMGVLLAAAGGLLVLGPGMLHALTAIMRRGFHLAPAQATDAATVTILFKEVLVAGVLAIAPFLLVVLLVAVLAPLSLGGWSFAPNNLAFQWEKLDPVRGLKRVFSVRGLMELAKALSKFVVVAGVAVLLLWYQLDALMALGREPLEPALGDAAWLVARSFVLLCVALVIIAAVDVPFQLWHHARQLRMTRQEVKDEFKETEGKPEVRQRIRSLQREVAQRRMMEEVPKADVIVTNPSHFSVALRYDPETMVAPKLVAKGADLVALRIREVARQHRVPTVSIAPLARSIYFSTRLDAEIPVGLYVAVAQVLAYVYHLRRYREGGGEAPVVPADPPIPEDLRRDP